MTGKKTKIVTQINKPKSFQAKRRPWKKRTGTNKNVCAWISTQENNEGKLWATTGTKGDPWSLPGHYILILGIPGVHGAWRGKGLFAVKRWKTEVREQVTQNDSTKICWDWRWLEPLPRHDSLKLREYLTWLHSNWIVKDFAWLETRHPTVWLKSQHPVIEVTWDSTSRDYNNTAMS